MCWIMPETMLSAMIPPMVFADDALQNDACLIQDKSNNWILCTDTARLATQLAACLPCPPGSYGVGLGATRSNATSLACSGPDTGSAALVSKRTKSETLQHDVVLCAEDVGLVQGLLLVSGPSRGLQDARNASWAHGAAQVRRRVFHALEV
eukprot:721572-Rhodomonas_salina.1